MKPLEEFKRKQKKDLAHYTKKWNFWQDVKKTLRGADFLLHMQDYLGLQSLQLIVKDQNEFIDWLAENAVPCHVFMVEDVEVFTCKPVRANWETARELAAGVAYTHAYSWSGQCSLNAFVRLNSNVYHIVAEIAGQWGPVTGGLEGRKLMKRNCGVYAVMSHRASYQQTLIGDWNDLKIKKGETT